MANVADHYASSDIARNVLAAAGAVSTASGGAPTPDKLAAFDHFHGGGLASTRDLVAMLEPRRGEHLLDLGSGIGGPARWIAATFDCRVTGIDLTPAFCRAAEELNDATGMSDRVRIVEGSALDLPFDDASFERAYSQNVLMNIADKPRFYREALRVLKPGGLLALSVLAAGPTGPPHYPVPWAATAATSFLSTAEATRRDLEQAGFALVRFEDTTQKSMALRTAMRLKLESEGLPAQGPHVFMGERLREYQINAARSQEEGRLVSLEILVRESVMRTVIGGKLKPDLTPAQEAAINPYRKQDRVVGRVMSEDEASSAYMGETRQLFAILAAVVFLLTLAVGLLAESDDEVTTYSFIVIANVLLWLFLFSLLRRRIAVWTEAADGRGSGLPPQGTSVTVDDKGLEVAGQLHAWPSLRIDQVDLADHTARGVPHYFVERLSLATASEAFVLDSMMIGNGRLIVGNAWRRLRAGQ